MKGARTFADGNDPNLSVYNAPQVVAYYGALEYLSPAERLLFDRHLHPGDCILDLGVGGGRTTPYLSSIASRYVGADYAPEMIALCRRKFPDIAFVNADATKLLMFGNASLDAVVMAFNGFDYVLEEGPRRAALGEIRRILKPGGVFIFSSHNPRALWHRPSWNAQRIGILAERMVRQPGIVLVAVRAGLTMVRALVAWAKSIADVALRVVRRIFRRAFWRGEGYMVDPTHGGLLTHYGVPDKIKNEVTAAGFYLLQILGDDYPQPSGIFVTDWYYYVFSKIAETPVT
jgi:SAM-dependent methyltransferase